MQKQADVFPRAPRRQTRPKGRIAGLMRKCIAEGRDFSEEFVKDGSASLCKAPVEVSPHGDPSATERKKCVYYRVAPPTTGRSPLRPQRMELEIEMDEAIRELVADGIETYPMEDEINGHIVLVGVCCLTPCAPAYSNAEEAVKRLHEATDAFVRAYQGSARLPY